MLLYVESKAFPLRTFIVRVQPFETVARVRAQILHILYELRREHHQFRLRYKGEYMRDAYTVEDYGIIDSAVIKMIPLAKKLESLADLRSLTSGQDPDEATPQGGIQPDVKQALLREIQIFNQREKIIFHFKGLLYLHFLFIWLSAFSEFWYSAFWTAALWLIGTLYCPMFTRFNGFIGKQSIYKTEFCMVFGSLSLCQMAANIFLSVFCWSKVIRDGCKDWVFEDDCSYVLVYSGLYYAVQALCLLISSAFAWALLWNIKVDYGDFIEKQLVQSRAIEEVLAAGRSGRVRDRRVAAFELATMAASGDDNKFRIVAEGGLELLTRMALSRDSATQENAVEALAELMTVPAIQDTFVESGGVRTLSALLLSKDQKLVYQASTALSYITQDSDENKWAVATEQGLSDLCRASRTANLASQRLIAGIFLDLAFNSDVRMTMASKTAPAEALVVLARSSDPDTQRFSLQTLELLAIESAELICSRHNLLKLLLDIPEITVDDKVYLLAGKILLYFAETDSSCEDLISSPRCHDALFQYACTKDPTLQKVVAKVIYCCLDTPGLRARVEELDLAEILQYVRDNAADREAWDMADQALSLLTSASSELKDLPTMTHAEKLKRFTPEKVKVAADFGSRSSLRSSSGSSDDIKKPPLKPRLPEYSEGMNKKKPPLPEYSTVASGDVKKSPVLPEYSSD